MPSGAARLQARKSLRTSTQAPLGCREAEQLCAQIVDIETGNQLCYSNFWSCSNTMCHPQGCSVTCLPLNSNKACGTLSSSKRYFALRFPLQVPENLSISYNETSESKSSSVASNTFEAIAILVFPITLLRPSHLVLVYVKSCFMPSVLKTIITLY